MRAGDRWLYLPSEDDATRVHPVWAPDVRMPPGCGLRGLQLLSSGHRDPRRELRYAQRTVQVRRDETRRDETGQMRRDRWDCTSCLCWFSLMANCRWFRSPADSWLRSGSSLGHFPLSQSGCSVTLFIPPGACRSLLFILPWRSICLLGISSRFSCFVFIFATRCWVMIHLWLRKRPTKTTTSVFSFTFSLMP